MKKAPNLQIRLTGTEGTDPLDSITDEKFLDWVTSVLLRGDDFLELVFNCINKQESFHDSENSY
jgi:hypothetical protein